MAVIDVTEADFQENVIDQSHERPVVVDFWAAWCGPCRMLGPILEQAARKREGDVVLAKIDTDANRSLAARFRIQGIPAVKAFKDGKVVAEFVGAQPPQVVERFFDGLELVEPGLVEVNAWRPDANTPAASGRAVPLYSAVGRKP